MPRDSIVDLDVLLPLLRLAKQLIVSEFDEQCSILARGEENFDSGLLRLFRAAIVD